ncbi:hypothetical protein BCR42DRAFT_408313 [Absidia repens]|uniref:Uncharacterized protein n=1 Tax=Absidia repens TaxID=90262 RepID=A0A1X2IPQ0_9FUNG|nr:hypothetical protein BCR42DRAFT_408313 [Absidia repens]
MYMRSPELRGQLCKSKVSNNSRRTQPLSYSFSFQRKKYRLFDKGYTRQKKHFNRKLIFLIYRLVLEFKGSWVLFFFFRFDMRHWSGIR